MANYQVDGDALFSSDEDASQDPPAPPVIPVTQPPRRSRNSSALDSLDSLSLFNSRLPNFGRNGYGGDPPHAPNNHHTGRRGPPPLSNGYGGRGLRPHGGGGRPHGGGGRPHGGGGRLHGNYGGGNGSSYGSGYSAPRVPEPALGAHMRSGGPAPSRGRPGIHPSRLAAISAESDDLRPRVARVVRSSGAPSIDDDDNPVIDPLAAAASILPEGERERVLGAGAVNVAPRKRPSRRVRANGAGGYGSGGGGGSSGGGGTSGWSENGGNALSVGRETELHRAAEARRAQRERKHERWAVEMEKQRSRGYAGFNLESMKARMGRGVGSSAAPPSRRRSLPGRRPADAPEPKRARTANEDLRTIYMNAALGKEAIERERRKAREEIRRVAAEFEYRRQEEFDARELMIEVFKDSPTVAKRMRDLHYLKYFEDKEIFGGSNRSLRNNLEPFGLARKELESDAMAEQVLFIEVTDLDV